MNAKTILLFAASLSICATVLADDWPQWRGPTRDGVWKESGIIDKFEGPEIKRRWSVPIGGGYSGPTVAEGRVYVTDRIDQPVELERVHCFDWKTGENLWTHEHEVSYREVNYPAGPRAAVAISDGRAYSLGATGHLFCFAADSGEILWSHDCYREYGIRIPNWGITASPIVDGKLVIVMIGGEKDACLVAFHRKSGKEVWRALADRANYAAPIIIEQAGRRVLVVWTGDRIVGLAPASGTLLWDYDYRPRKMPLGVATPILHKGLLYFTGFYDGSLLLRLDPDKLAVEKVWHRRGKSERSTDALHSIISTPVLIGGHIYGVDSYGELRCLELMSGDRVWEDKGATPQDRWSTIHFVHNGARTWMFNEAGELIIAKLSHGGFTEISRAKLIEPTPKQLRRRLVAWSHPAYAYRHIFARNDRELICASLAAAGE